MLKRFLDWVIYGDRSQEPSEKIEFLKGLHPMSSILVLNIIVPYMEVKNENVD
jgi:hypothetical protein